MNIKLQKGDLIVWYKIKSYNLVLKVEGDKREALEFFQKKLSFQDNLSSEIYVSPVQNNYIIFRKNKQIFPKDDKQ